MEASARRDTVPTIWRIPDDLWLIVRHVLPPAELRRSRGRPWIDSRRIVDGVLYVLRTGCQWKAVPREYGSGSTVHRRFQRWVEEGAAPKEIIATKFKTGVNPASGVLRTRPLCPYPQTASYKGSGSTDDAANFVCK